MSPDDLQALRKRNLRALIKQWDGPTNLARKLRYSGPSYLSQMVGSGKPVTEKTARYIESTVGLPTGWLDTDHTVQPSQIARIDASMVSRVMLAVGDALEDAGLRPSPARTADLAALIYEDAVAKGGPDPDYLARLINIMKGS